VSCARALLSRACSRWNKYLIWAIFGVLLHFYRDQLTIDEPLNDSLLTSLFASSACAVFAVGARKVAGGKPTTASRVLDAAAVAALAFAAHTLYANGGLVTAAPPPPPPPQRKRFGIF
jgi:hypothetical protein